LSWQRFAVINVKIVVQALDRLDIPCAGYLLINYLVGTWKVIYKLPAAIIKAKIIACTAVTAFKIFKCA
jgi:hypothetical protein